MSLIESLFFYTGLQMSWGVFFSIFCSLIGFFLVGIATLVSIFFGD